MLFPCRILLNCGSIKAIFACLQGFKDYDKVLSEIYGYLDPSYNFKYLATAIKIFNNFLTVTAGVTNLQEYANALIILLEQSCFDKLKYVMDIFFGDVQQKKIDFKSLSEDISAVTHYQYELAPHNCFCSSLR